MDHVDVVLALREAGQVEDLLGDNESDTIERLRDGQVKFGVVDMNTTVAIKDKL
jgi:hypothetical protein